MNTGHRDAKKILLTSLAASAAETATFPIDLLKTRLQLHGESMQSARPASAYRMAFQIARNDGVLGMYRGLSPAIFRHIFYTPTRIVGSFSEASTDRTLPFYSKALIGGISGSIAQIIASPADLIKVRMQADGLKATHGLHPRYSSIFDALNKIIRTEGLLGLWKGVSPNAQRAFLVNMGELSCYDYAKRSVIQNRICNDNIYAHTLSSVMSGLSATALSCPADVVKTRLMNQVDREGDKAKYRNSYDCLVKTIRIEGLRALWKGFFLRGLGLDLGSLYFGSPMRNSERWRVYNLSNKLEFLSFAWPTLFESLNATVVQEITKLSVSDTYGFWLRSYQHAKIGHIDSKLKTNGTTNVS